MDAPERKVVVITGASAGLGRAMAQAFARRGWRIGILARDADALAAGFQVHLAKPVRADALIGAVINLANR